jgi:dienelactone hydrolase
VIAQTFHAWERRLSSVDTNRVVRPFEWGLEWIGLPAGSPDPAKALKAWVASVMAASDAFYAPPPTTDFERSGDVLRFPTPLPSPFPENNTVVARVFPGRAKPGRRKRAVIVVPQWNSDAGGHVGLCELYARFGITALRMTMPYHDVRRPPELERADYIVSANIGRTIHANRQAVLDLRRAVDWLHAEGYERIGVQGTSLGSCLTALAMAHDPRIAVGAFNHVSPYFADVVWRGLSTRHVRAGLEGHLTLEDLREFWRPISPWPFIDRIKDRPLLNLYARYDLTFPVDLSRKYLADLDERRIVTEVRQLPCGHYTSGRVPFKFMVGYHLTKFLVTRL